jgi:RNA polymerase sigma factor, sigma-70 family
MVELKALVEQAKRKDKEAFAKLYELVYQDMYRFALYTLKNPQDAEDVVSDTVVDAYESIRKLRNADAFKGWIFKILSNKCRRKMKDYVNKTAELSENISIKGDFTEDVAVQEAFMRLSNEERLIISMSIFAGYSSREIGAILKKSDNTVRSDKSRALKKMEQMLNG